MHLCTIAVLLAALTASCTSATTFRSTWRAPDAAPVDYAGKKVAALFFSSEESTRRAAEDALAREITARGAEGVAAYTLLSLDDLKDKEGALAKLQQAGCAGAVAMRITGEKQQLSADPGMYSSARYSSFSGYSHWGWGTVYEPGYLRTDTIVSAETLVYSLTQNKLLWGGKSESFNPARTEEFVVELAEAAADEMKKEGLIR